MCRIILQAPKCQFTQPTWFYNSNSWFIRAVSKCTLVRLNDWMDVIDDKILLDQARQFDRRALGEIYDHYSPMLYAYAYRQLGSQDQAEECVAETFSRFLQALRAGKGPVDHLRAYLYQIAHNWITDLYRRGLPPVDIDHCVISDPSPSPGIEAENHIEQDRLRSALQNLTPEQRQVVVLRYLEGFETEEISSAMRKPPGAIKALQHRAVFALRRWLENG